MSSDTEIRLAKKARFVGFVMAATMVIWFGASGSEGKWDCPCGSYFSLTSQRSVHLRGRL